jgi:hypothetical protein
LRVITRLPVDWAKDTVFGNGLESFKKAQCLQNATADSEVVECNLGMFSIRVSDILEMKGQLMSVYGPVV